MQVIAPQPTLCLPLLDLSTLDASQREHLARQLAQQEAGRPFDLAHGPLLRTHLLRLAPQEHVVLLTLHHIISDGWSMQVLVQELTLLYQAAVAGQPHPLPPLPVQYADFALWQRDWLQGEVLQRQVDYWTQQLAGLPPLDLPTDFPRPPVQSFRGAQHELLLPVELRDGLRALSQREGVTLFMTLLAAFQVLLARYSGQHDIAVGSPIANRGHADLEDLIGFFVNTLVLRTDLSDQPSFLSLLARVREVCLGAYAHQDVPFEKLVELLQPTRDLSRSPLFQVLFGLQEALPSALTSPSLAGLQVDSWSPEETTAKCDLSLVLTDGPTGLHCSAQYCTDLFAPASIQRLLLHFHTLLAALVAAPEQPVTTLPLFTPAQLQHLLVDWNRTAVAYPLERSLPQLFAEQAERSPQAVAVVFQEQHLTYALLEQRANLLAHRLLSSGLEAEQPVAVCAERSPELLVALLAILKAGAVYVPLEPSWPHARLDFILHDAQAAMLLTQTALLAHLPAFAGLLLCLDAPWSAPEPGWTGSPVRSPAPSQLAYIMYTSGSTGQPKGVGVSEQAIVNRLLWGIQTSALSPGDRVIQLAACAFDISLWELCAPLLVGATLVLPQPGVQRESAALVRVLREEQITLAHLVPTLLQAVLNEADSEQLCSLRCVLYGGEASSVELKERFFATLGAQLHHYYGPTEAAINATWWVCRPQEDPFTVPIGRPIANVQVYVLDTCLQPVPLGAAGELYIAGVGLARGYWQRPDLTAERFVPHPFAAHPGERLYRTGDRARYRPDGALEYLGRLDSQVKLRGYRIELGEIEAVLSQYAPVDSCAVRLWEEAGGDKRLVGYVVGQAGQAAPSESQLRQYLRGRLPEYMLPARIMLLATLPLSPNGKVDRRALPDPTRERSADEDFVPARTPFEQILAGIWAEVLHTQPIGIRDNFFDLGGDSILSMQIVSRAGQKGLKLTVKQLFQYQTIEELGATVDTNSVALAEQGPISGLVPLTPVQHYFFSQQLSTSILNHWNQSILLEIPGGLTYSFVEKVTRALLRHHDALRLRFEQLEGNWRSSIIETEEDLPYSLIDLSGLPSYEQNATVTKIASLVQESLHISEGPLIRLACFNTGIANLLLISIHHLAVDGVSWRVMIEDLHTIYQQLSKGQVIQLPFKTSSYKQWVEHLVEYARSDTMRQELIYWLNSIPATVCPLPVDHLADTKLNTVEEARTVSVSLTAQETKALLEEVPSLYHTQINAVLLTALAETIAKWSGERAVLIDMEGHGREDIFADIDVSRTVGWFTSLFPVFLNLEGASTEIEALSTLKEQLRRIPYNGIGYGVLRYLSKDDAVIENLQALPRAQVLFNYLGQFDQVLSSFLTDSFRPSHLSTGPAFSPSGMRTHLLAINCQVSEKQLHVTWEYCRHVHLGSTIEQLASTFLEVLRSLISHCQDPEDDGYAPSDFTDTELEQIFLEMDLG